MDTHSLTDSLRSSVTKPITKSPEVITPSAFDHERRQQSGRVAVFNLVSTMVGGGVLSLPFAVSRCGLGLGLILLFISALASDFSFDILVSSARRTGAMTYAQIAYFAFGNKTRFIIPLLVFILCWMASIAYLVIMGDLFTPVICFFGQINDHDCGNMWRTIAICGGCALVSPVCYFRSLEALKYTSVISLGSVFVLAGVIMYQSISETSWTSEHAIYFADKKSDICEYDLNPHGLLKLWPESWEDVIYVFPIFGVSFLCHFNIPQIHSELTRPSRKRVRQVLHATVLVCSVLYSVVGTFGYLWSFEYTCGNILLNYKKQNVPVTIGRLGLGLTVMLSFPLLVLPARGSLHNLLNQCKFMTFNGMNLDDTKSELNVNNSDNNNNNNENDDSDMVIQHSSKINDNDELLKQKRDYFNNDMLNATDYESDKEDTPQQSLQPIDTNPKNTNNNNIINSNEKIVMKTKSASPQVSFPIAISQSTDNLTTDDIDGQRPMLATSSSYNDRNVNMIPKPHGSRNIQVLDRRAQMYEAKSSQTSLSKAAKPKSTPKSFLTRSFSGLDSPLRKTDDAIAVVHSRDDLEKFSNLKELWDTLDSAANHEPSNVMLFIETTLIIATVLFLANEVASVLTLWTVMGSTVSFLIGFTFPGAFFYVIRKKKKSRTRNKIAALITGLSFIALIVCTWQAVMHVSDPPCPEQPYTSC